MQSLSYQLSVDINYFIGGFGSDLPSIILCVGHEASSACSTMFTSRSQLGSVCWVEFLKLFSQKKLLEWPWVNQRSKVMGQTAKQ